MKLDMRVSEAFIRRLDALAEARRVNRSQAVRLAVSEASGAPGLPEPPDRDVLLRLLGEAARGGSIPAIRLLLDEYRRDGEAPCHGDPFAEFDDMSAIDRLARRRMNGENDTRT